MIPFNTLIKCSNESCNKPLFRTSKKIETPQGLTLDRISMKDIPIELIPKIGDPAVCPYCKCQFFFLDSKSNKFKINTENGWLEFKEIII